MHRAWLSQSDVWCLCKTLPPHPMHQGQSVSGGRGGFKMSWSWNSTPFCSRGRLLLGSSILLATWSSGYQLFFLFTNGVQCAWSKRHDVLSTTSMSSMFTLVPIAEYTAVLFMGLYFLTMKMMAAAMTCRQGSGAGATSRGRKWFVKSTFDAFLPGPPLTRTNSEDDAEDDNVRLVFSHSVGESFGNHDDQVDHDYEECVAEVS